MESDEDAMDLEDLPDDVTPIYEGDPLEGLYDDAAPPPEDGTVDPRPLPRDWESILRTRVPKRRRPPEYATATGETDEPFAKMPRIDMEDALRALHLRSENQELTMEERHQARVELYKLMRANGYQHQSELDEANRPFQAASLRELQHRIHDQDRPMEERNRAREELYRLMRDLGYYQFRIPWRPGADASIERITANSVHSHPLLGDPLLLDVIEFPNFIPGEAAPRAMPEDALGTHRRLAIYPTVVVDLIDEGFIRANHNKRRLTVHLPNMAWAREIQHFAQRLGAHNVAEEFNLKEAGQCTDLVHYVQWLVGQTCYSTLRSSQRGYWYYQEFKSLEFRSGESLITRINPFGIGHMEYLKYLFRHHLLDLDFKQLKPKEYEMLQETWMGAMQSLEDVQLDRERRIWYDSNFPSTHWMPVPVKQLLTALARDCIEEDTGRLHWHPSWNALDYCLLMGEWYLTSS